MVPLSGKHYRTRSSVTLVRVECTSLVATSILEAKSFTTSRQDSLRGSTLSWGFCPESSMKGDKHVEA